jgi:hypothetical protein
MNQISTIPLGTDITQSVGYFVSANDRLGAIDIVFENTGPNQATVVLKQYVGTSAAGNVSGYVPLGTYFTLAPGGNPSSSNGRNVVGGTVTKHYTVLSKQLGVFGSGNTTINATVVIRNRGDLRGSSFDFVPIARKGYGYDSGYNIGATTPNWGAPPDAPNLPVG